MRYKVKKYGDEELSNHAPIYAGIDQSYSGFAYTMLDSEGNHYTRVAKFDGTGVKRLHSIREFLTECFDNDGYHYSVADVAMEGYAFGSQMANTLGELGGLVKLAVYDRYGIQSLVVPPTNLKKYVTGKGTGVQKNQMLLHMYKKWGVEFTDDNAADSYALARLVAGLHSTAYEKETYSKLIEDPKYRA